MLPSEHPNQGYHEGHTHRTNRHKGLRSTHVSGGSGDKLALWEVCPPYQQRHQREWAGGALGDPGLGWGWV